MGRVCLREVELQKEKRKLTHKIVGVYGGSRSMSALLVVPAHRCLSDDRSTTDAAARTAGRHCSDDDFRSNRCASWQPSQPAYSPTGLVSSSKHGDDIAGAQVCSRRLAAKHELACVARGRPTRLVLTAGGSHQARLSAATPEEQRSRSVMGLVRLHEVELRK